MLIEDAKSMLREAGVKLAEREGALILMVEDEGREVIVYIMAEEERGIVYVIASANPPISLGERALDALKASWEIADRGVPCKVSLNGDIVVVEHDIDSCHFTKESLLESIYFAAESMLYLMKRLSEASEGDADL